MFEGQPRLPGQGSLPRYSGRVTSELSEFAYSCQFLCSGLGSKAWGVIGWAKSLLSAPACWTATSICHYCYKSPILRFVYVSDFPFAVDDYDGCEGRSRALRLLLIKPSGSSHLQPEISKAGPVRFICVCSKIRCASQIASTELVRENQPKLPVRLVQLSLRSQAGWNRSIPENER